MEINQEQGTQMIQGTVLQASSGNIPKATIKLVSRSCHIGPEQKKSMMDLSKTVGRVKVDNNLSIKFKSAKRSNPKPQNKQSVTIMSDTDVEKVAIESVYWIKAFESLYGISTKSYLDSYAKFVSAQNEAYAELGIQPGKKKPILTRAQQEIYNQKVAPSSFKYEEVFLSIKIPGKKSVRTILSRGTHFELESMINNMTPKVSSLKEILDVSIRK